MKNSICTYEESARGFEVVDIEAKLRSNRKLFIEGEINEASASRFTKEIMYLLSQDKTLPIDIYINSPGGSVLYGYNYYIIMQDLIAMGIPLNVYCIGQCASFAAILLMAGPKGRRFITNSYAKKVVMIHEPLISQMGTASASNISKLADNIQLTKKQLVEIISKHTGKSVNQINKLLAKGDCWFSAEEAIEWGIADSIKSCI